ncbi:MAG TPA: hypothetical protein VK694_01910 [Verrucomicrobiae bacterium]|nr:hypothetical protein [Verrucomicrobiae bacterium]
MESPAPKNAAKRLSLSTGKYVLAPANRLRLIELAEQRGPGDPRFVSFSLQSGLEVTAWYVGKTELPDGSTALRYHVQTEESKVLPALLDNDEPLLEIIKN